MKKISFLIFFLFMCLNMIAECDYMPFIDSAEVYIKTKEWAKAEMFMKKALTCDKNDPNNSLLLSNLATLQRYQGKNDEALQNYSLALFMTPNAVTVLENRASLYFEIDSIDRAYKDYEKIQSLDSKHHEARYYHGMIALRKKNYVVAKGDFEEILADEPKSSLGIEGMGLWYKSTANYHESVKCYNQIIKIKPTFASLLNRAECFLALNRLNDASKDIKDALAIEPEDGYAYLLRAKLNRLLFENDESDNDAKLAEKYGIDKRTIQEMLK